MTNKVALICGINGQDGSYLAKFLLSKGYTVYGTSREETFSISDNHKRLDLKILNNVFKMSAINFQNVKEVIKNIKPDEIYNLSGQSSVAHSFKYPKETLSSISMGVLNILEAIRLQDKEIKFYNASSGEIYGGSEDLLQEDSPMNPKSPYGAAKLTALNLVKVYRESYGMFASSGIAFNHESKLRQNNFVTKKIITTAKRISSGSDEKLFLGDINIIRDWGYAPEFVEAMWKILQHESSEDFIISTGHSMSLKDFVAEVFLQLNLDWEKYVKIDQESFRPNEIRSVYTNPSKANVKLRWKAEYFCSSLVTKLLN